MITRPQPSPQVVSWSLLLVNQRVRRVPKSSLYFLWVRRYWHLESTILCLLVANNERQINCKVSQRLKFDLKKKEKKYT